MAPLLHNFWPCDNKYFPPPDPYVAQICNKPHAMVASPIRNFYMAAQESPHSNSDVLGLFRNLAPGLSVQSADPLPASRAQQAWLIKTDHGHPYILSLPTGPGATPLSLEKSSLVSESLLLHWLSSMPSCDSNSLLETQEGHEVLSRHGCLNYIAPFLPCLNKHAYHDFEKSRPEYLLTQPTPGVTISSLSDALSRQERAVIRYQSGCLMRRICGHTSPNGKFGPVYNVLQGHLKQAFSIEASDGYDTWAEAFQWMLESVVKDLEGKGVMAPYIEIKTHLQRLFRILNRVKRPSLVAIDAAEDSNVLVERKSPIIDNVKGALLKGPSTVLGDFLGNGKKESDHDIYDSIVETQIAENNRKPEPTRVTGLRNWSNCIFGDPLMAAIFARDLPQAFIQGLKEPLPSQDPFVRTSPIEDAPRIMARSALYQCFHGLVLIARNFYHHRVPPNVSDEEDLQLMGRKQIKMALQRLESIDDAGNAKRR